MNDNINRPIDAQKPARPALSGSERGPKAERRGIVRIIGEVDRPFLLIIIALLCIGSVMVFSAYAKTYFTDSYYCARKQIEWAVLGLVAMCAVILVDYRLIKRFAWLGYGFALLLNAAVVVMGIANNGAQRWIKIGSLQFQPSELLKFFIIIVCASYISNNQSRMKSFKYGVLPFILILAKPFVGNDNRNGAGVLHDVCRRRKPRMAGRRGRRGCGCGLCRSQSAVHPRYTVYTGKAAAYLQPS